VGNSKSTRHTRPTPEGRLKHDESQGRKEYGWKRRVADSGEDGYAGKGFWGSQHAKSKDGVSGFSSVNQGESNSDFQVNSQLKKGRKFCGSYEGPF
jgi:hypothetical protein